MRVRASGRMRVRASGRVMVMESWKTRYWSLTLASGTCAVYKCVCVCARACICVPSPAELVQVDDEECRDMVGPAHQGILPVAGVPKTEAGGGVVGVCGAEGCHPEGGAVEVVIPQLTDVALDDLVRVDVEYL